MLSLSDFEYELPPGRIAQTPLEGRSQSRLLVVSNTAPAHTDAHFSDLPQWLLPGDLLVFNDTRVIHARLHGHKDSGGQVEVLFERSIGPHEALAQVRASKSPKPGSRLQLGEGLTVEVLGRVDDFFHLRFPDHSPLMTLLERHGALPLPPYIARAAGPADEARYQTVYARHPGSVAAPTAGLHFDEPLLERLRAMGVGTAFLTLHVGAGTFQPVRTEDLSAHVMHEEAFILPDDTVEAIARTRQQGGRVIAVGTTSLRAMEGAASAGGFKAGSGTTRLFITPGFRFQVADGLITNFHLPKSTLLMLVSAFAGLEVIRSAYRHAIENDYRFFSYGDAMLLWRNEAVSGEGL
jgi:S-adenosylmethionine:tRNA ribosyltransferase-isomerase